MSDQWDDEPAAAPAPPEASAADAAEILSSGPWRVEGMEQDGIQDLIGDQEVTSFDQATQAMLDEKAERDLEAMGGADNYIPGSERSSQEKWREMVKARTESLGIEESQVSKDAIAAAKARAATRAGSGPMSDMLDLSQVTYNSPFGSTKKEQLSIEYNPEDDLTEEQMNRADPLSLEPIWTQMWEELKEIIFPDAPSTISKVVLLVILAVGSSFLILATDSLVRDLYERIGILPTVDDIELARQNSMKLAQELTTNNGGAPPAPPADAGLDLPDLGL